MSSSPEPHRGVDAIANALDQRIFLWDRRLSWLRIAHVNTVPARPAAEEAWLATRNRILPPRPGHGSLGTAIARLQVAHSLPCEPWLPGRGVLLAPISSLI